MKKNKYQTIYVATVMILLVLGCNLGNVGGPASLKNLKIASDEEGRVETREFKPGEKVYAIAEFSGNTKNAKVEFVLSDKNERPISESKRSFDLKEEKTAVYWLELPPGMSSGRYYITAKLIRDENSKGMGVTELRKAVEVK